MKRQRRGMSMKSYAILVAAAAVAAMAAVSPAGAQAMGVEDILSRLDANVSFKSIRYSGRMEITIGGETRVKTMRIAALGSDKAFVEFTNPEDRGLRYLKLQKNLWMYFPKEQDVVPISGHLLKIGMMGSDMSYEDGLESQDFRVKYSASIKGQERVDGRPCVVVELAAKVPTATYDRRLLWVDEERWIAVKQEMYAKSGKLLKTSLALEVKRFGDRWFPVRSEFVSTLRRDTRTVLAMDSLELDPKLEPGQFTMAALKK
jgi:outer membrane lipoprotein-sorting protein